MAKMKSNLAAWYVCVYYILHAWKYNKFLIKVHTQYVMLSKNMGLGLRHPAVLFTHSGTWAVSLHCSFPIYKEIMNWFPFEGWVLYYLEKKDVCLCVPG